MIQTMDAYKIGIRLTVHGGAAAAVAAIGKELSKVNFTADQLTTKFGRMHVALGAAFGGATLAGLTAFVKKTADLSHQLTQIRKLGNQTSADITKITSQAINVTKQVAGINERQALEIYGSVYSLVGKRDALKLMNPLAKFDVMMANTTGNFTEALSGSRDLVRAAEQIGRLTDATGEVDLNKFSHFLDFATKVGEVTHGQVGAQQWLQIAKQGGPALMGMTDRSLAALAVLSQYMGGPRVGTAIMSTMQQFAGGTMYARNAQALQDIGILKSDEWSTKGGGGRVILTPEARSRLAKEFNQPLDAVLGDLIPKLKAAGYTDPDKMIQELFAIFSRQTTQRVFADLIRNKGQIVRELNRINSSPGLDQALGLANTYDVKQNIKNLDAAWRDLMYALAGPNSSTEISVLKLLTGGINDFTAAVRATPPVVIKALAGGLAALSAVLVGAGAVALMGALGVGGWIALGITALGAAVAAVPWRTAFADISDGLKKFGTALAWLWDKVKGISGWIANHVNYYPGSPGSAVLTPAVFESPAGNAAAAISAPAYSGYARAIPSPNYGGYVPSPYGGGIAHGFAGAPRHSSGGGAPSDNDSGGVYTTPNLSGLTGNAYIKAVRSPFAQQLKDPNTRLQVAAMMLSEDGRDPLPVVESLMNRAAYAHKPLLHMLHNGFYGPINRGQLPRFEAELRRNPKLMARMNAAIAAALNGSDIIKGSTDQGMVTDKNGRYILHHFHVWGKGHGNIYGDWNAGATRHWRENFEAHAHENGDSDDAMPSPAIAPPHHGATIILHHQTMLDGRVVAKNTMRHISRMGNQPPHSARLPDPFATMPSMPV